MSAKREQARLRDFSVNGNSVPWSQVKATGMALADAYADLGAPYRTLAARMRECGRQLEFQRYAVADREHDLLKLKRTPLCRARLCPSCQIRLARRHHYTLVEVLRRYLDLHPANRLLLLTLTQQNTKGADLGTGIDALLGGHRRLTRYRRITGAVDGWYRTLEVTRNLENGTFHPHLHNLLCVPPSYFDRKSQLYIDQAKHEWSALWRRAMGCNYDPIVDIRVVSGTHTGDATDLRKSLAEVSKYATKPSLLRSLAGSALLDVHAALKGRRLTALSRNLRAIAKQVDIDLRAARDAEPSALMLPDEASYLGRELYHWRGAERDYVLAGTVPHTGGTDDIAP